MNQVALDFIKARENCKLLAYLDSGGKPTVGWGATGPNIVLGGTLANAPSDYVVRVH